MFQVVLAVKSCLIDFWYQSYLVLILFLDYLPQAINTFSIDFINRFYYLIKAMDRAS